MSNPNRLVAKQLTDKILDLIAPDEIPSYTPKEQEMLTIARNKLFTAMLLFTRVDPLNSKLSLNTIENLVPKEELSKVYAAMEQQIRYDIEHPEEKKDENKKNMPDHVFRRTVEINTIEFTLFKQEFKFVETDPSK